MKNSRFIIATVLLSACTPMVHAHEDVLRPLQNKIEKDFLNRDSALVAKKAHKGKHLSKEFQEFLDSDELVLKMIQVGNDGTGEFAVKVINKKDAILKDIVNKRHELEKEETASAKNETWSKIGISAGIVLTLMGVAVLAKGDKKFTKRAITLSVGGLIVAGGCEVERRWSAEELAQKQVHRTEVTKMEEKWEHNFAALQKVADK